MQAKQIYRYLWIKSIRFKIIFFILMSALMPMVVTFFAVKIITKNLIQETAKDRLSLTAKALAQNITIWDDNGNILDSILGFTGSDGYFNVSFTIELSWNEDTSVVKVYFFPEDPINFGIPDGTYIEPAQQQIFREP